MRSTLLFAALEASYAGATPILDSRQIGFHGTGTMTTYSATGCRTSNVLVQNVAVSSSCKVLDSPVDSVLFHGGTGAGGLPWIRESHNRALHSHNLLRTNQSTPMVTRAAVLRP